jgi:hypothetical protein
MTRQVRAVAFCAERVRLPTRADVTVRAWTPCAVGAIAIHCAHAAHGEVVV